MLAGLRVDELRRDPDAARRQLEAALHHVSDPEVAGDLANVGRPFGVGLDRIAGNHHEAVRSRQLGDQVLGEGGGEPDLAWVAIEIVEGQHRDRQPGRNRRRPVPRGSGEPEKQPDRNDARGQPPAAGTNRRSRGRRGARQHQAVAAPRHGANHHMRLVAQRPADFVDALHQAVVGDRDPRPDGGHQLVLGDEAAGIAEQVAQHRERLAPHRDGDAVLVAQNLGGEVDLNPVDGQHLRRRAGHTPPPPGGQLLRRPTLAPTSGRRPRIGD